MNNERTKSATLKLLDVVALMKDLPEEPLIKGQVGTFIEELDEGIYEVEFANKQGKTLSLLTLTTDDLMLLHFEIEAVSS